MLYKNEEYREIAELGGSDGCRTVLAGNGAGESLIFKEIEEELIPVYQTLCGICLPNIVRILDFVVCNGKTMVILEYFPSATLEEKLLRQGKLSFEETKRITIQICEGVYGVHRMGIVHRDLCPANILIGEHDRVKITDFGIARLYKKGKTMDTTILGTPGFAAPEQFGFAQTDEKADIYSIGVLMNWMLTGKMPQAELYQGDVRVSAVIRRCLSMQPEKRCSIEEIEEAFGERIKKAGAVFSLKRLLKRIPGFRTGNRVHMILALMDYIYMSFGFMISILVAAMTENGWQKLPVNFAGYVLGTVGIGWFVGGFEKTAYIFGMGRGWKRGVLAVVYVILGAMLLMGSFVLMA